ncbi:MAG: cobalt ECF transporter T component CbiQ [Candidatus Methanosuratincola petrocarbonis]|nr:cobalt ECF transporter T component CbiQ [Candidatus Methanosuratincola sp.]
MKYAPISVRGLLSGLESLLYVEESVSHPGILNRIDPLIRNISLVSIIFASLFTHSFIALSLMLLLLAALVVISGIAIRSYVLKTSVIPLFSLVIAIPIPFITPGVPLWSASIGPLLLAVSYEGMLRVAEFVMRVWLCVGVAVLITMVGGINGLLSFLGAIRLPGFFTQTLALTYRYVFLSINESMRMLLAREARTFRKRNRLSLEDLRGLSGVIAALLVRIHERSDRVYLAMRARGFSIASTARPYRWRPTPSDISFLALLSSFLLIILSMQV